MNKILLALCLSFAASSFIASPLAYAKDEKAATPQQERMSACNKEAADKGLKADERKKFMSQCLKGGAAAAPAKKALTAQQQRMVDCNKEAKEKNMAGPERKKFMSECLKKS